MKSKVISLFLAAILMLGLCATALADDPMQAYGTPTDNGDGITTYFDGERTYSAQIKGDGLTWLFVDGETNDFWVALDNSDKVFEEGSVLSVKVATQAEDKAMFDECYRECKIPFMENKSCLVIISAHKADGTEYAQLSSLAKIYVQVPENWDISKLQTCYLDTSNVESAEYVARPLAGGSQVLTCKLEIKGLDSTMLMGQMETGYVSPKIPINYLIIGIACLVGVCVIAGVAIKVRGKKDDEEE